MSSDGILACQKRRRELRILIMKNFSRLLCLVLMGSSLSFSLSAQADGVCGVVQSITKTTKVTQPQLNDNIGGGDSGPVVEPVVQVQLAGKKDAITVDADKALTINLLIAAFTAKSSICYNDLTGDVTVSR